MPTQTEPHAEDALPAAALGAELAALRGQLEPATGAPGYTA